MRAKTTLLGACALGMLLLAGYAWLPVKVAPRAAPPPSAAGAGLTWFAPFAPSMAGTRPDGRLRQDSADRLVVDAELGYLFDYYLAGLGERDLASIRREIGQALEQRLRPAAAAEAKRLLARYLDYKAALVNLEVAQDQAAPPAGMAVAQAAARRFAAMRQLRQQFFSAEESAGLFAAGDAYDDDAIGRLAISADASLEPAQRQQRLAALELQLPADLRAGRAAAGGVLALEASVQQLRAQGGDDNQVYRARAAAFSPAAADRLAQVDREDADWQRRIALYRGARERGAGAGADADAIKRMRDELFTPDEQKRLPAYE